MKEPKNLSASIHQRLLNRAKRTKRPFNELLQYYVMERFLYRLSQSIYAEHFILKGGLLMRAWEITDPRPTMDIDLLGITSNREEAIVKQMQEIMTMEVKADGLIFEASSIQAERIIQDATYEGLRIRFLGYLGTARTAMQIDIGFGDHVYPKPQKMDFPSLLDFSAPRLLCYSQESCIAEKLEIMVKLGVLNSRMKDFYDVWQLSQLFPFDGEQLSEAIRQTFAQRGTEIPQKLEVLAESFVLEKQTQWMAFWKRLGSNEVPTSLETIVVQIDAFLSPVITALFLQKIFTMRWSPTKFWH